MDDIKAISIPVVVDITTVYGFKWVVWSALFLVGGILFGVFIGHSWKSSEDRVKVQTALDKTQEQIQELQNRLQKIELEPVIQEGHAIPVK